MRAIPALFVLCLATLTGVASAQVPVPPTPPNVPFRPFGAPVPPRFPARRDAPVSAMPPVSALPPEQPVDPDRPTLEGVIERARERRESRRHYKRASSADLAERAVQEAREAELKAESESVQALVDRLLAEYGPNARYGTTDNFILIYDTTDRYAAWVGELFEQVNLIYESLIRYARMPIIEPSEPMVVVLFTNKEDFEKHLRESEPQEFAGREVMPFGLYSQGKNRSFIYDISGVEKTKANDSKPHTLKETTAEIMARPNAKENIAAMIHEASHQVAFNRGLFARGLKNPEWAVEGLAMIFEGLDEVADNVDWRLENDFPINDARKAEYLALRDKINGDALRKLVALDSFSGQDPVEYPGAWALFYYLYNKEPRRLAQYLFNSIQEQPRESYPIERRLYDFELYFGADWAALRERVDAFITGAEAPAPAAPQTPVPASAPAK